MASSGTLTSTRWPTRYVGTAGPSRVQLHPLLAESRGDKCLGEISPGSLGGGGLFWEAALARLCPWVKTGGQSQGQKEEIYQETGCDLFEKEQSDALPQRSQGLQVSPQLCIFRLWTLIGQHTPDALVPRAQTLYPKS